MPVLQVWVHRKCSGIRGKLKEDSLFKYQTCANQQTNIAEDCPGIELNGRSLEIVEKFFCLSDTIEAREVAIDNGITRIRSGWCRLRDLMPF